MNRKRPLETAEVQDDARSQRSVFESIKNLRLQDAGGEPGSERRSSLLPPQVDGSQEKSDADYAAINPILREAHYLRQLRHNQRSSGDRKVDCAGGSDEMEQ